VTASRTSAEAGVGVPPDPGDPGGDPAAAQAAADAWNVVALVGVQLDRPAAGMAATDALDRRHRIQNRLNVYSHVMRALARDAADRMGAMLLTGKGEPTATRQES